LVYVVRALKGRIDYARLVKEPTPSLYPISPRKSEIILMAGLLGVLMFTMAAFFIEHLEKRSRVKNRK
jgi:uncharacterized protein involved in exopolysaccharide biosynthesis